MKYLLIAEKPSLMRTIQDVYFKNRGSIPYEIEFMAQAGHLVTLLLPSEIDEEQKVWKWENLPFDPNDFGGWKYKVIPGKEKLFNEIKTKINSGLYDGIIHAADPDQEGQLLCNLVLQESHNKLPVKRFWTNDLTDSAVLDALIHLRDNDKDDFLVHLGEAALARQHSDYRIGMNISEAASLKTNIKCAIGRVKSPMTKIVVDRERAIRNFKPTTTYELKVNYKEKFFGILFDDDGNVSFKTKEEAEAFAKTLKGTASVSSFEKKREKKYAPPLFKLATLQIEAGKLGYNADKVLGIAQSLYEKKYMSYPRTSCEFLASTLDYEKLLKSISVFPELKKYADKVTKADIDRIKKDTKYVDDKKLKESGHYALSPTTTVPNLSTLNKDETIILEMVFKQFMAIFLPPLVQDKTTIITNNDSHLFKSTGKILVDKGYTELLTTSMTDVDLPTLKNGDVVNVDKFEEVEKTTTCPKRFTDGDLIQIMENPIKYLEDEKLKSALKSSHGIGTPATRAGIINQLITKDKYIERKKGKGKSELIYATLLGEQVIDAIGDMDVCKVDMTGIWEEKLDDIRLGKLSFVNFEVEMIEYIEQMVNDIKNSSSIQKITGAKASSKVKVLGKCPICGRDFLESEKYFLCSGYSKENPECRLIFKKEVLGKKLTEKEVTNILTKGKTSKLKFKNPKTGKNFETELILNKQEFKLDFNFEKPSNKVLGKCPKCGKDVIDKGVFIACESYKDGCNFAIAKKIKEATLDESDLINLLEGKETSSKKFPNGKAKLKWDTSEGKLKFVSDSTSLGKCPKCGKEVLDRGKFASCEGYKNGCDFSISYSIKGANLTSKDIKAILIGKETDFKKFSFGEAKLKYNKTSQKLDFIFKPKN